MSEICYINPVVIYNGLFPELDSAILTFKNC